MKLSKTQRLILYSLGMFYRQLNQPLVEKPIQLQTSKVALIELLLMAKIITQRRRALYKNLEALEQKKLIAYENKMIRFTDTGLLILAKIDKEVQQFQAIEHYFPQMEKPKRKLQTVIKS